jgi:molybdate-binding protein/DNA-binding XRE family transcriptional regulator
MKVENQLSALRRSRGIGAADLARRVGVSRQTIYAIEAGSYLPNTEVTLKLARELEVSVEELFTLGDIGKAEPPLLASEVLSATALASGQSVQVCRVDHRLISVPVTAAPYFLPEADGIIAKPGRSKTTADLAVFSSPNSFGKRLTIAGCDPAIGLLARTVERLSDVELICAPASSRLALNWLKAGKVHIAGMHLKDSRTGEFNVPIVNRELSSEELTIITFACWEEGFVTAPGNPKQIRSVVDLAQRSLRFMNREPGSGSRALLDALLQQAGMSGRAVAGFKRIAHGHIAAAYAVSVGEVDCCLATESAARAFSLAFVPLQTERYDFVLRRKNLDMPAVQNLFDILQRAMLRRKLQLVAGYDTAQSGRVVM